MNSIDKLRLFSFAIVNLYYMSQFKTIAPCKYFKYDGDIYVAL